MPETTPPGSGPDYQRDREPNPKLVGSGRVIYVASAVALTDPGPAAAGIVVADGDGRLLARRAHYVGNATRHEASARGLLAAVYLALDNQMEAPLFRVDDSALVQALAGDGPMPEGAAPLADALHEARSRLPGHGIELARASANLARPAALAPLVEWLPERTLRAEGLSVRRTTGGAYEVASETQPSQVYRVTLGYAEDAPDGDPLSCQCADFQYRGIPCKHVLAVAREEGALEHVFQAQRGELRAKDGGQAT